MKRTLALLLGLTFLMAFFNSTARGNEWEGPPFFNEHPDIIPAMTTFIIDTNVNCIYSDTNVCTGEIVTYSATNVAGHTYFWNVTGGTASPSITNTLTVTWGSPGSGLVALTVINTLSGDTVKTCEWAVTIHDLPLPVISASFSPGCERPRNPHSDAGKDTVDCLRACDSSTIVYSTPMNPGSTYSWNVSGDISHTASGNTVTVNWGAVGNGMVGVTETDVYGCSNYIEVCIEIIESPTALFGSIPAAVGGVIDICMLTPTLSQLINFIDSSQLVSSTPIINWYWDFGDGQTSTLQNPTHQYSSPGSYDVWLVVENECHCKDSMQVKVVVNDLLGPDISCASTVCTGSTETYTTSANCTDYNWVVTGGTIAGSPPYGNTISVNWGSPGPGTVSLDVAGCDSVYCTTPTTIMIPIIGPTTNVFGPAIACEGDFSTYSVDYLPGCTYSWSITPVGAGSIVGATNTDEITVYWPVGSTGGTVTVDYYNPELDCGGTGTLNVTVGKPFSISGPLNLCMESSGVSYLANPGTYNWTVEDDAGTVIQSFTGASLTVNWTSPTYSAGTYEVIAEDITGTYCNSPQSVYVTLYDAPPAPTAVSGPDSICPGSSYTYTASPAGPGYYLAWDITGGTPVTATGNSVAITWDAIGPYSIDLYQLTSGAPNCSSAVFTYNVYPTPLGAVSINGPLTTCNNSIVSYSATPGSADSYTWTITPSTYGSVISGQGTANIDVQWNNALGVATLALEVKGCGDTVNVFENITLTGPPPPVIVSADSGCTDNTIAFSTPTSGSGFAWNFGDGSTASAAATSHDYALPGNYLVTLTITDPGGCIGTSTISKFILIHESPSANLTTPDPTLYCPGDPISTTMYINSQPGNTFEWFGPGAFGWTGSSFTTNTTGSYYVIVTSPNGCTTQSNTKIIVQNPCDTCTPDPGSAISFTYSGPNCNVVNFNGSITGGASQGWQFDDPASGVLNSSTLMNPTHIFTEAGYYNVSFGAKFPGTPDSCLMWDIQTITIPAVAEFEWEIDSCSGGGFVFNFFDKTNTVTPYSVTSWNWSFGGGIPASSALQDPSGVILSPGPHVVSLTITSSGGTTCVRTDTIVVPALPVASFTSVDSVCEGNPVLFTSTSTGSLTEHYWDFGDLSSSLLQPTTERTYDLPGTYTASLTVTDSFGCTDTYAMPIVVTPNTLGVTVTAGGPTTFCQGDSVMLTANPTGGTLPYGYSWSPVPETTQSIQAIYTGDYTVTIEDQKGCLKTSDPVAVIVNDPPIPLINGQVHYCAGEVIELNANQGPSNTYQWFINGSPYTSGPIFSYPTTGATPPVLNVSVAITGANGCTDTSAVVPVFVHPLPLFPTITPSSPLLCAGTPITLTASNTEGLTDYVWSTGATGPVITTSQGGIYTVAVYNEFGCGRESSIYINDLPDFSNLMTGCYEFCDTADVTWIGPVGPYVYQWLLNGSAIPGATSANYTIPAGASGSYQLVISESGCKDTSDVIDITFIPCGDPCEGHQYIKNIVCGPIDGSGNQTYLVDIGLTNPFGPGATFTLNTPMGVMSSVSPATLVSGYNSVTGIFTDLPPSNAGDLLCLDGVITGPNLQVCSFHICFTLPECETTPCEFEPDFTFDHTQEDPCTMYFTGLPQLPPGLSLVGVSWDFGDGNTSTSLNPVHTYVGGGTYLVCFTVVATNGIDTCEKTICKEVFVEGCEPPPCKIKAAFVFNYIDHCTIQFTSTSTVPAGVTITGYLWDFGDGNTSTSANPTHSYTTPGTYVVCLTVYATNGYVSCFKKVCKEVTVEGCEPPPCKIKASFIFNPIDPCAIQFTSTSTVPAGVTITGYLWDFGDGFTSTSPNPAHTYSGSGTYTVCLTVYATNGFVSCFRKVCAEVTIGHCSPGPCKITPDFSIAGVFNDPCTFQFTDLSTAPIGVNIYNWFWDFGDGSTVSGVQNPMHTFSGNGIYNVCVTVYATNGSVSCFKKICKQVNVTNCFEVEKQSQGIRAWPNPSAGAFYLDIEEEYVTQQNVQVMNSMGKAIPFETGVENGNPFIDLGDATPGVYHLLINKDGALLRTTVVKN